MPRSTACWFLALTAMSTAAAAQTAPAPATQPPSEVATGSPSNATATVSPTTVADATARADETTAPAGKPPSFGLSLGTSIAGGDFGSGQGSRLWSTALGARYATGAFRLTVSVPYLQIRSRGVIFSGIDSTPVIVAGGTPGPRRTNKGLGDVTIGAAYTMPEQDGQPEIELSGRVKLPTASGSSRLSTGKTDYSFGIQATKTFGGLAPFVSATYRIFGDPATIRLRNGFAASAGTSIGIGKGSVVLLSYHYAQAASRLVRDSHELFAGASTRLPHSMVRLTAFATKGVSSGAAAASGGASLALDF